jgi:hypothetical protein
MSTHQYTVVVSGEYSDTFHFIGTFSDLNSALALAQNRVDSSCDGDDLAEQSRDLIQVTDETDYHVCVLLYSFPDTVYYWVDKNNLDFAGGVAIVDNQY